MKIMLTGGGTLGPVTPLIAVVEALRLDDSHVEFVWVGTPHGPEAEVVLAAGISFLALSVPKLTRHAPARWIGIPFGLVLSCVRSLTLLRKEKPDVILSAGGYVSVPIIWMATVLGIPSWIHQQDVRAGLANKLMAPFADRISVAWEKSLADFDSEKTIYLGNPVRASLFFGSRDRGLQAFSFLNSNLTILIMGGGTGSSWINDVIGRIGSELEMNANVLHITGVGKSSTLTHSVELVSDGMADVFAMADVVICRAGMGTISELAALKKSAIIIPMPNSHQEDNARILDECGSAIILHQSQTTPQMLLTNVIRLLDDEKKRFELGQRLHHLLKTDRVAETLAHHLIVLAKK
ncbi:MAG: UDP-N-acetylglucosamine--N-acetylmuramyl-(pentapeptide) pyrophosphoryl-undecaprenol N-acetylglucosamine transferase [Patescibacteria group bacterium]